MGPLVILGTSDEIIRINVVRFLHPFWEWWKSDGALTRPDRWDLSHSRTKGERCGRHGE